MTAEEKEEEEEQNREGKALGFVSHVGFSLLLSGLICTITENEIEHCL